MVIITGPTKEVCSCGAEVEMDGPDGERREQLILSWRADHRCDLDRPHRAAGFQMAQAQVE